MEELIICLWKQTNSDGNSNRLDFTKDKTYGKTIYNNTEDKITHSTGDYEIKTFPGLPSVLSLDKYDDYEIKTLNEDVLAIKKANIKDVIEYLRVL